MNYVKNNQPFRSSIKKRDIPVKKTEAERKHSLGEINEFP